MYIGKLVSLEVKLTWGTTKMSEKMMAASNGNRLSGWKQIIEKVKAQYAKIRRRKHVRRCSLVLTCNVSSQQASGERHVSKKSFPALDSLNSVKQIIKPHIDERIKRITSWWSHSALEHTRQIAASLSHTPHWNVLDLLSSRGSEKCVIVQLWKVFGAGMEKDKMFQYLIYTISLFTISSNLYLSEFMYHLRPLPCIMMIRFHRCFQQQVNRVDKVFWDEGTNGSLIPHSLISICAAQNTPCSSHYRVMQVYTTIQNFEVFFFFERN